MQVLNLSLPNHKNYTKNKTDKKKQKKKKKRNSKKENSKEAPPGCDEFPMPQSYKQFVFHPYLLLFECRSKV